MPTHALVGQRLHQSQLHRPARKGPQRPVVIPLGTRGAGQGDEMGPGPVIQLAVPVGLGPVPGARRPARPRRKRRLMRYTLDSATSRAWATLGADQPSLVLSRMRARAATRAGLLPARTRCSNRSALLPGEPDRKTSLAPYHHLTTTQSGATISCLAGIQHHPLKTRVF